MTNTTDSSEQQQTPGHTQAMDVKPGNVVILITSDGPAAFIKTERIGKEYIHHYAVQIFPRVMAELGMVYLDPEDEVFDTALGATFQFGDAAGQGAEAGHVLENAKGHFDSELFGESLGRNALEGPNRRRQCSAFNITAVGPLVANVHTLVRRPPGAIKK